MKPFDKSAKPRTEKPGQGVFWLLLILAALLRLHDFSSWSLTNDELSAVSRLQFNSLGELFQKGVAPDGHPAFVQVFLYFWTFLFGDSPFALRLPFVLAGIGSCYFAYGFVRDFVHQKAAQVLLALMACSQIFILYSQLARPYSFGLFFVLGSSYFGFRSLQKDRKIGNSIAFIVMAWLGILSHYFASLNIFLFLAFGFFFLNRDNWKAYLISLLAIFLLCLPHLSLTLGHLEIGGVAWVPPPSEDFLSRFLIFVFNDSPGAYYCFLSLAILFLMLRKLSFKPLRIWLLPMLFFIPYAIAWYYSVHQSPVLQFSVLIFSLPFLLASPIALMKEDSPRWLVNALSLLIVLVSFMTLFKQSQYGNQKAFANFKGVAEHVVDLQKQYGSENILHFSNSNNPQYLDYYYRRMGTEIKHDLAQFDEANSIAQARDQIEQSEKKYVLLSFANVPVPAEVYEYVKESYPVELAKFRYFNSELAFYGKGKETRSIQFEACSDLNASAWSLQNSNPDSSIYYSSPFAHQVDSSLLYALTYENQLTELISEESPYLSISAQVYAPQSAAIKLVFSVENDSGSVYWRGIDLENFKTKEDWFEIRYLYAWDQSYSADQKLKVYFWNPNQIEFWVDDFCLRNYAESDYAYYELD